MGLLASLISIWLVTQLFFYGPAGPEILEVFNAVRIDRLVFICIVGWFCILAARRRIVLTKLTTTEWFMLFFLITISISLLISGANNDLSEGKNKWLNAVINISYYPFATYYIVKSITYSKPLVKKMVVVLCLIGFYLTITSFMEHYQVVQYIWPRDIINPEKGTHFGRSRGPFLDAVSMGRVLTVCFSCFILMMTQTRGFLKGIYFLFSLLAAAAVYFTQTRGPWIGFGLVVIVYAYFQTTLRKFAIAVIMIITSVALFGITNKLTLTEGTLFSERQNTIIDREISYMTTIKMIVDHPVFGIGFGMFNKEWSNYFHGNKNLDFGGFDGSHNTFLTMICELGCFGFAIYFFMFISMISLCYKTFRKLDSSYTFEKCVCLIAIGLSLMYIVTGSVSDLRWSLMVNNLVYMFFGSVAGIARDKLNIN